MENSNAALVEEEESASGLRSGGGETRLRGAPRAPCPATVRPGVDLKACVYGARCAEEQWPGVARQGVVVVM